MALLCNWWGGDLISRVIIERLDIKCINEQHPRAGLNTQHVLYKQLARAGRNT